MERPGIEPGGCGHGGFTDHFASLTNYRSVMMVRKRGPGRNRRSWAVCRGPGLRSRSWAVSREAETKKGHRGSSLVALASRRRDELRGSSRDLIVLPTEAGETEGAFGNARSRPNPTLAVQTDRHTCDHAWQRIRTPTLGREVRGRGSDMGELEAHDELVLLRSCWMPVE